MKRRLFIRNATLAAIAMSSTREMLGGLSSLPEQDSRLPALFIGHGNPMNALEDNDFTAGWIKTANQVTKPKAVLCISAHWETNGTKVTAMPNPRTIHDFMGFPKELFNKQYPAPGAPEFAKMTAEAIKKTHVELDSEWGLDHGSWSVLCRMYPLADVPVYQMSLDYNKPPQWHYELAAELRSLRKKGVLIIGSGNMVHNLGLMRWNNEAFDWAKEFDAKLKKFIAEGDHDSVIHYDRHGTMAHLSIPTNEHYLPLLYTLGLQEKNEPVSFFNEQTVMGSISMRSVKIG
jgi:4,5-DOPA dioxygenase extradiol